MYRENGNFSKLKKITGIFALRGEAVATLILDIYQGLTDFNGQKLQFVRKTSTFVSIFENLRTFLLLTLKN